jgi:hypothetical protein
VFERADAEGGRFASGLEEARNSEKYFAMRNETFRIPDRKSLKSLLTSNQWFRGIVCFQWLTPVFVSPFSQVRGPHPKSGPTGCEARSRDRNGKS